jgi:hypothetical protein
MKNGPVCGIQTMGIINTLSNEALLAKNVMGELTMGEVWIAVHRSVKAVCIGVRREEDVEAMKSREFWTNDMNWDFSPGGCVWFNIYNTSHEDVDIGFAVATDDKVRVVNDRIYATDTDGVDITIQILSNIPVPFSVMANNA